MRAMRKPKGEYRVEIRLDSGGWVYHYSGEMAEAIYRGKVMQGAAARLVRNADNLVVRQYTPEGGEICVS